MTDQTSNRVLSFSILAVAVAVLAVSVVMNSSMQNANLQNTHPAKQEAAAQYAYPQRYYSYSPDNSDSNQDLTFPVTGTGSIVVRPDIAVINLAVDTVSQMPSDSLRNNSNIMFKIIQELKALEIEDKEIRTANIYINPEYTYDKDQRKDVLSGYRTTNYLVINTNNLDKVDDIIDVAFTNGASRLEGVQFFVSEEVQNELREQLFKMAVEDAKNKARMVLEPLGLAVKGVKNVSMEPINQHGIPITKGAYSGAYGSGYALPQIIAGKLELTANVYITFLIG